MIASAAAPSVTVLMVASSRRMRSSVSGPFSVRPRSARSSTVWPHVVWTVIQ
jgi:hypothetical protein